MSNWRNNKRQPFTSDLSGQDFWTLIRAGYAPLGLVMGSCVYHIAHQRMGNVLGVALAPVGAERAWWVVGASVIRDPPVNDAA